MGITLLLTCVIQVINFSMKHFEYQNDYQDLPILFGILLFHFIIMGVFIMPKIKQGVLYYKIPERGNESFYA
jgi:uncharacterized integral membrane protein